MTIVGVTKENFAQAAEVYEISWRASHEGICTAEFLRRRDCTGYLERKMKAGSALYLLFSPEPVGVVSVSDNEIGDLYVLPEKEGRGFGSALLKFAMQRTEKPMLTVLSNNERAIRLYTRFGFITTDRKWLREGLWELTMEKIQ